MLSSLLWTSVKGDLQIVRVENTISFLPLCTAERHVMSARLWAPRNQRAPFKVSREPSSLVEKPSGSTLLIMVSKLLIVMEQVCV